MHARVLGSEYNFEKYDSDTISLYGSYDINSIMHYECYAFALDYDKPTITVKNDPDCTIPLGQPTGHGGFRQSDIYKLNTMYC